MPRVWDTKTWPGILQQTQPKVRPGRQGWYCDHWGLQEPSSVSLVTLSRPLGLLICPHPAIRQDGADSLAFMGNASK